MECIKATERTYLKGGQENFPVCNIGKVIGNTFLAFKRSDLFLGIVTSSLNWSPSSQWKGNTSQYLEIERLGDGTRTCYQNPGTHLLLINRIGVDHSEYLLLQGLITGLFKLNACVYDYDS